MPSSRPTSRGRPGTSSAACACTASTALPPTPTARAPRPRPAPCAARPGASAAPCTPSAPSWTRSGPTTSVRNWPGSPAPSPGNTPTRAGSPASSTPCTSCPAPPSPQHAVRSPPPRNPRAPGPPQIRGRRRPALTPRAGPRSASGRRGPGRCWSASSPSPGPGPTSAALQALGSSRFHAVADAVALLASEVPLAPGTTGRGAEALLEPAEHAEQRLICAVAALPPDASAEPYNEAQDAPWHQTRLLLRLHRYAHEVVLGAADPVLTGAGHALDLHRDAAEAAAASPRRPRTPSGCSTRTSATRWRPRGPCSGRPGRTRRP
ncbi:exported protein of unknown function [Streptomyces sp. KY70]|nr:exported protein of unknown function [Streptomyces sp. KY70]